MKRSRLRSVSARQARRVARYAKVRAAVLVAAEGRCARCGGPATETHHRAGRIGERLTDPSPLVAVCRGCHQHIHAHPSDSYAAGWMVRRTGGTTT